MIFIVLFITVSGCSNEAEDRDIEISSSSVSIGAVFPGQEGMDQKLTYSIVMKNPDSISIVDSVDVILTKIIKDRIIKIQSQSIHYDDQGTINISGEVILDMRGLTKEEISQYNFLKGVQFIGDDNVEYFLPIS
jgi:hypothetical protein